MTLLYLWVGGALSAQSTQLHFRQFTTEDGLPSSETYVVFEDHEGYIWIGTDNGVARYDGYEFEVFDSNDGLDDVVVFTIIEDHSGKVWVGTFSGDAYYFEGGRFHAYEHNEAMQSARLGNEFIHLIDVRKTGELVFRLQNSGVIIVEEDGTIIPLKMDDPADFFYYTPECSGPLAGRLAPIKRNIPIEAAEAWNHFDKEVRIIFGNDTCSREIMRIKTRVSIGTYWPIEFISSFTENATEKVVMFNSDRMYFHEEGKELVISSMEGVGVHFALPESGGVFWLGLANGKGLRNVSFDSANNVETTIDHLKGRTVSFLTRDRRGGLWASTTDAGVYYCPFPEQRKYILNKEIKPLSVAATAEDDFYVGYEDETIFHHFGKTRVDLKIDARIEGESSWRRPDCLFFDTISRKLFSSSVIIDHPLDLLNMTARSKIQTYRKGIENELIGARRMNFSTKTGPRKLLLANISQFGIFDLDKLTTEFVSERGKVINGVYSFAISSTGQFLLGTTNGLKEYDPNHPEVAPKSIDFGVEELNTRIIDIEEYRGGLLFATRGEGVVYLKDGKKQVVKELHGLASDMIRDLEITVDEEVWVATLTGLSKIDFDKEVPEIRTYRTEHGLISNEVYDINIYHGVIWLATSSGVQRFLEHPPVEFSPSPIMRQLIVDGDTMKISDELSLGPGDHSVELFFSTINFSLGDQITYRYQIEEGGQWRYTDQRKVNFPKLGPGNYSFAVASQNEDKVWSEPTKIYFTIGMPWYQTWWALMLGGLLFTSLISFFFLRRERNRRKEQNLLLQINTLEHEALHAQMNPHFVFNALNSIQNFVVHNDAKQAATYLSRFALVVRQTLNSSVKGQQTLAQEISMLETYLSLEKLRFKEAFQYEIALTPDLPVRDIILPPLLIQPFVENAILHGLKEIEEGGLIQISFSGTTRMLKVAIEDNGTGFETDQLIGEGSMGMAITRRRLAMMEGKNHEASRMEIEPLYNAEGNLRGTKVILWIYLEKFLTNKDQLNPKDN